MEEQNKNQNEGKCGGCGCWGMQNHVCWRHVVRLILGIVILLIVFSFGVMIGELRGSLESNFGYRMMGYQYGGGYGRMYPMMQNWGAAQPTGAPVATTTP